MAISTGAAILGSAVIGGATSMMGASASAGAARDAQRISTDEARRQFDLVRSDTAPYRQLGNSAIGAISRLYGYAPTQAQPTSDTPQGYGGFTMVPDGQGGFTWINMPRQSQLAQAGTGQPDLSVFWNSPDYQFNLGEGQKAIDRSLASRGRALSGAGVKEGQRYASGLASREFGSFYDRLASQAGIGQTGIGASAAAGANAAGQIGQAALTAGAQRGSAYMAGAQGVNNAVQGGIQNWMLSRYLGG